MFLDPRQAQVEAQELDAQAAMVNSQAVENRGIEVVDMDRIGNDVVAKSSVSPYTIPGLIPPPAIQTGKHFG